MPDKKTKGEEILELFSKHYKKKLDANQPITFEKPYEFRVLCVMATQLERIADRMDDMLETGLPTR